MQFLTWLWRLSTNAQAKGSNIASNGASPLQKNADAFYREIALARLNAQLAKAESFDTKALTMFTIGSTVLPITAGLITADRSLLDESAIARAGLILAALLYLVLVACFFLAYRLAKWDIRPDLRQWDDLTANHSEQQLERWLGDAYRAAYESNLPQIAQKSRLVSLILVALSGEAVALMIAILIPLLPW